MSTLVIVRHGQASFLADNYDKLSPLGEKQARLLGDYWARQGLRFTHVYYGPCERQIRTGEIVGAALREAGAGWPEPRVVGDFDEYPAEAVMRAFLPILQERLPELRRLVDEFARQTDPDPKRRLFDKVLRDVSLRWMSGEVSAPGVPSWEDFYTRVERGVTSVREEAGRSAVVAVFTSAGPMAATGRLALELSARATMELTWSPRNAAFSEFLYTKGRFSMLTFNETPHLDHEPGLVTYR